MQFSLQLLIWGAAWSGNAADTDAVLAESGQIAWDSDSAYLDTLELHIDGQRVATPSYWALPAVTDLLLLKPDLHPSD